MACPFFMPIKKLENGAWPHASRLPLGGGWSGYCSAPGYEGEVPERESLEQFCNLGYARGCHRLPPTRAWDAVRFAVAAAETGAEFRSNGQETSVARSSIIHLRYVCEREHRPVEHGRLRFDGGGTGWLDRHLDIRLQKMAECFLDSWLNKKTLQSEVSTGTDVAS